MDRFEALSAFVAVADHRSFTAAARALGISPAKATRTVAALEAHLGVSLFHRSTRSVSLSHEGAALLERARGLLSDLRDAEHLVMGGASAPQGELHVTAPVMFGRLHVLPVIARLLAEHGGLSARMMLIDRNVRIVEEGIDVAVRIGELTDSSLMTVRLGKVRQTLVASPDYLERRGTPRSPADLVHHECIGGTGVRYDKAWRFAPNGETRIPYTPRLTVDHVSAKIAAAEAGVGIANVLSYQVAEQLRSGQLVRLLADDMPLPVPVQLLYHSSRAAMPAVRAFIDGMRMEARQGAWESLTG
ncbi:LysR family transcriptional regulator [Novosphingobium mangrovi (ex Huang et al. 2023)]|uniref:LysR family transcriptional regulator n=1 Tax=Novosphingobium mangrovi (ex Huang et al. 2023) TaxID=2976432 RepID=A0ABT2I9P9_9SPHN|nr:LysR family transcriptional regulator [Novosphingobium mangrovi (ex Huang et al. 2023)]MCT2401555.1 LysR family transcriptional regulator [Novosphingobium mangrovi (ex Huang et al. 2023)]